MNNTLKMVITLTLIGVISGGVLFAVNKWSEDYIREHSDNSTKDAIFQVIPGASDYKTKTSGKLKYFEVFDNKNKLAGYALPCEGNGFQGKIKLMAGLSPDIEKITGIKILEQTETPGLGSKITDNGFSGQFVGLEVLPKIGCVKGKPAENPNEIQAITGATISSKSVVKILNEGIKKLQEIVKEEN
ncbi:MAG: FMN-binding protein [Ignavibacteria bacterium]|nr:FMN-binding protein [Ignavibacteria bacterium]